MRLDENKTNFLKFVVDTAAHFRIASAYVEKDYWLTMILKSIFANDFDYVFKGGTSLSKCFRLINRFSEDIDVSYPTFHEEMSTSDMTHKFRGVMKAIKMNGLDVENKDRLRHQAYFNQFRCPYPTLFPDSAIEKTVIIELAGQTPSFPTEERMIQSFIGEYLHSIGKDELAKEYGLEAFKIKVQTLERTLVDKTFALCDYYMSNGCRRHSRHIYDITKILGQVDLNDKLADLFKEVRRYRKMLRVCYSSMDGVKLHQIFEGILESRAYESDFNRLTSPLLYEPFTYVDC